MPQWRMDEIEIDGLTSTDLQHEAALADGVLHAYRVTIWDEEGIEPLTETADALWVPDTGRMGIAWGADAEWVDALDPEDGMRRWMVGDDD